MVLGLLRFTNSLGGTANFIYPGPTTDMQSPASAGAADGTTYLYYAQSFDMSQWEIGTGAYTASSGTFARTTISANSLGTTAKINFGTPPQVVVFDTYDARYVSWLIAQSLTAAQQIQSRQNIGAGGAIGSCTFAYVSATSVALKPFNGSDIRIAGTVQQIPSGGVTATNAGLVASTLYYVYAFMSAGVMTLEFSATAHATDTTSGNIGVEIKSGDNTRTLVGVLYTNASSQFDDSATKRNVRSWFNRRTSSLMSVAIGSNLALPTPSLAELSTTWRTEFVCFANESLCLNAAIQYYSSVASQVVNFEFSIDGATVGLLTAVNTDGTGHVVCLPVTYEGGVAEGHHLVSVFGNVNSGVADIYQQSYYSGSITQ